MTSQKSLKNNTNKKDFLRSLGGAALFPVIAFIVLSVTLTFPMLSELASSKVIVGGVSYFISENSIFYYNSNLLYIGMTICGMLTAVKQYYFMMSKKQVNVYFSLGISRKRLFINRAVSSLILLFASVFIPGFLIYAANIVKFGSSAHLTGVFLYLVAVLFISAFAGFSIGAFAASVTGNLFEMGLTCATVSLAGIVVSNMCNTMKYGLLKGYMPDWRIRWPNLFSPFTYVMDLNAEYPSYIFYGSNNSTYNNPLGSLLECLSRDNVSRDKWKIPEDLKIDGGFIIPLLVMLVISAVVFAFAVLLFKKRNAEHANSLGHFKISSFINSAFAFIAVMFVICEITMYDDATASGLVLRTVLIIAASFAAYFIVQLILTRKIKVTARSLIYGAALPVAAALYFLILGTGVFGIYNKTPDKASVKSIALSCSAHPLFGSYVDLYNDQDNLYSEKSSDIDMAVSVFDNVKNEKYIGNNSIDTVEFAFKYDNGKIKYRSFSVYDSKVYESYLRAYYNSDYFDAVLKDTIFKKDGSDSDVNYSSEYGIYYTEEGEHVNFRNMDWTYLGEDPIVKNSESDKYGVEMSEELMNAIYNDLSKMSYEQLFKNNSRPLGQLTTGLTEAVNVSTFVKKDSVDDFEYGIIENEENGEKDFTLFGGAGIYLYPEMKETLACLEKEGYKASEHSYNVKEILYTDGGVSFDDVKNPYLNAHKGDYTGWGDADMYISDYPYSEPVYSNYNVFSDFFVSTITFYVPKDTDAGTVLNDMYKAAEHPLKSLTDKGKMDSVLKSCVPFYMMLNDEGRYIYVIYDDGTIVPYYIPQANIGVLK